MMFFVIVIVFSLLMLLTKDVYLRYHKGPKHKWFVVMLECVDTIAMSTWPVSAYYIIGQVWETESDWLWVVSLFVAIIAMLLYIKVIRPMIL